MNKPNLPIVILAFLYCINSSLHAQVGINTTDPRKTLEVAGDVQISDSIDITVVHPLSDGDTSTFLIQNDINQVKTLDVSNPTGAALGYVQKYIITNAESDWVLNFDTGINTSDYVVIAISSFYDKELILNASPGAEDNASLPYTATFEQNDTWRIIADFPMAANQDPLAIGTWTIITLIYSRDLSKQFGTVTVPMNDSTTGSAVNPIID